MTSVLELALTQGYRTPKKSLDKVQVGDPVSYRIYTDHRACRVVGRTKTTITAQEDRATLLNGPDSGQKDAIRFTPGGFCGHVSGRQRWQLEPNPEGAIVKFSRRVLPSGKVIWKKVGASTKGQGWELKPGNFHHYDFNF